MELFKRTTKGSSWRSAATLDGIGLAATDASDNGLTSTARLPSSRVFELSEIGSSGVRHPIRNTSITASSKTASRSPPRWRPRFPCRISKPDTRRFRSTDGATPKKSNCASLTNAKYSSHTFQYVRCDQRKLSFLSAQTVVDEAAPICATREFVGKIAGSHRRTYSTKRNVVLSMATKVAPARAGVSMKVPAVEHL